MHRGKSVVAGIRTPQEITIEGSRRWAKLQGISEEERASKYPSLEEASLRLMPDLNAVQEKLEDHFHDMQDMEFTIQDGKLWMLQTRNGKTYRSRYGENGCRYAETRYDR